MRTTFVTLNQLSDECGMSPRQLSDAIKSGNLIAERVGGRWIIVREDAEAFLGALLSDEDDGDEDTDFDDEDDDFDEDDDLDEDNDLDEQGSESE